MWFHVHAVVYPFIALSMFTNGWVVISPDALTVMQTLFYVALYFLVVCLFKFISFFRSPFFVGFYQFNLHIIFVWFEVLWMRRAFICSLYAHKTKKKHSPKNDKEKNKTVNGNNFIALQCIQIAYDVYWATECLLFGVAFFFQFLLFVFNLTFLWAYK